MKTVLYILLVVLVFGVACIVTCPDQDVHTDALKNLLNETITAEMYKDVTTEEDEVLAMLASMLGTGIGGLVIDNILNVDNYFVCSIGRIMYDGEERIVSVGLLNHVFTAGEENIMRMAEEIFN